MITGHIVNEHSPVDQMISRYNDSIKAFQEFHDDIASGAGSERKRGIMTKWEFWK